MKRTRLFCTLTLAALVLAGCKGEEKLPSNVTANPAERAPIDDPASQIWSVPQESQVTLMPQQVTYPMIKEQAVQFMRVKAMADEHWVAIRLEWEDKTQSDALEVDKFTDAVAVEIPLGDPAKTNPMMGDAQNPVYLCHWKAAWQRDVDKGRTDVQDLHPGYWADPYPFVAGGHPYNVQDGFQSANARRYMPGVAAGNPVSKIYRQWPVEELHATGFGSLADHRFQDARGKGFWKDGKWTVVLAIPREVADPSNPKLGKKSTVKLAFAVWDGGAQNVGGRKQWAPFVDLVLP